MKQNRSFEDKMKVYNQFMNELKANSKQINHQLLQDSTRFEDKGNNDSCFIKFVQDKTCKSVHNIKQHKVRIKQSCSINKIILNENSVQDSDEQDPSKQHTILQLNDFAFKQSNQSNKYFNDNKLSLSKPNKQRNNSDNRKNQCSNSKTIKNIKSLKSLKSVKSVKNGQNYLKNQIDEILQIVTNLQSSEKRVTVKTKDFINIQVQPNDPHQVQKMVQLKEIVKIEKKQMISTKKIIKMNKIKDQQNQYDSELMLMENRQYYKDLSFYRLNENYSYGQAEEAQMNEGNIINCYFVQNILPNTTQLKNRLPKNRFSFLFPKLKRTHDDLVQKCIPELSKAQSFGIANILEAQQEVQNKI